MSRLFATLLCAIFAIGAFAQQPKFGHIQTDIIVKSLPEVQALEKSINAEQENIERQLTTLTEDFTKLVNAYQAAAATMTPAQRQEKEEELMALQERIQSFRYTASQEISRKSQEGFLPIRQKVLKVVQEYGAQNGYLYIFESNQMIIPHVGAKSDDLTQDILKKLGVAAK